MLLWSQRSTTLKSSESTHDLQCLDSARSSSTGAAMAAAPSDANLNFQEVCQVCQLNLQRAQSLRCACLLGNHDRLQLLWRLLLSRHLLLEIRHHSFHGLVNPSRSSYPVIQYPEHQKTSPPVPTCPNTSHHWVHRQTA